ncbi:MAG: DUF368 domain-containing protein [Actinomycetota bacterium]
MLVRGFFMGAADIVPGVSGGTVALVFGIYERLLRNVGLGAKALGSLVKGDVNGFRRNFVAIDWLFILPLGIGILVAVGLLSSVIERQLQDNPEEMAGLFFGLVLGSIVVAWATLGDRGPRNLALMAVVGVVAFVLLGFQSGPAADPAIWAYFGAGAIAICAMILPGISGSFLLLMMGMYAAVLGAIHDRDLLVIAVFGVGAVIGLALFSTLLGWLLERYHDALLAALIGLMIGSLRVLWPWPNGVGFISEDESESVSGVGLGLPEEGQLVLPVVLAIVALIVVVGVSRLAPAPDDDHERPSVNA